MPKGSSKGARAVQGKDFLGAKENYAANIGFFDVPHGNRDVLDEADGLDVLSGMSDLEAKSFAEDEVKPALQTRALLSTHASYRLLHGVYVLVERVRGTSHERQTLILQALGSSAEITADSKPGGFQTALLKLVVYVPTAEEAGKKARKHAQSYLSQLGRVLDGARLEEIPPQELVQRLITFGGFQAASEIARAERRSQKAPAVEARAEFDEGDEAEDDWAPRRDAALDASRGRQVFEVHAQDHGGAKPAAGFEAVVLQALPKIVDGLDGCAGTLACIVDMDVRPPVLKHFLCLPQEPSGPVRRQFAKELFNLLNPDEEDDGEEEDD